MQLWGEPDAYTGTLSGPFGVMMHIQLEEDYGAKLLSKLRFANPLDFNTSIPRPYFTSAAAARKPAEMNSLAKVAEPLKSSEKSIS